jgi:ABC-type glycerol-3-phosphate transport system permease component
MTASTLATVPIVIVFVLLRTSFLSGLSPRGTGGR